MINLFSLNKIEGWEISSQSVYDKLYERPTWPGGFSGITIGVGYDLGYESKAQVAADWGKYLSAGDLNKLLSVVGLKGAAAKQALASVRSVVINYGFAKAVFESVSIPAYEKQMLSIYPAAGLLPGNVYGMLVSLVYNRGTSLVGDRRTEMKAIQQLVVKKDIAGIADQFLSMRRFWNKTNGLYARYTDSAAIIRACA